MMLLGWLRNLVGLLTVGQHTEEQPAKLALQHHHGDPLHLHGFEYEIQSFPETQVTTLLDDLFLR